MQMSSWRWLMSLGFFHRSVVITVTLLETELKLSSLAMQWIYEMTSIDTLVKVSAIGFVSQSSCAAVQ